jgi:hypothetical protein
LARVKNRAYVEETKDVVLWTILKYAQNAMSIKEIAKRSKRDRNIVSTICNDLEKEGFVYVKKMGKWKMIHPSIRALETPVFSLSRFLGNEIKKQILLSSQIEGLDMNIRDIILYHEDQVQYFKRYYTRRKVHNNDLYSATDFQDLVAVRLHNFILQVGYSLTYVMLQSLLPQTRIKMSNSLNISNPLITNGLLDEWARNIILSMDLLFEFNKSLFEASVQRQSTDKKDKSIYEIDGDTVDKSLNILHDLYPKLIERLDKIFKDSQKSMTLREEEWKKIGCDHDYIELGGIQKKVSVTKSSDPNFKPNRQSQNDNSKGVQNLKCFKCDNKISIFLDNKIEDNTLIQKLNSKLKDAEKREQGANNEGYSSKSKNFRNRNYQITDILGSSPSKSCKNDKHIWSKELISFRGFERNKGVFEEYQCMKCNYSVKLFVIDEATFDTVRKNIEEKIGNDIGSFRLADITLKQFYENEGKCYRIEDFSYLDFMKHDHRKNYSEVDFEKDVDKLLKILLHSHIIMKSKTEECFSFIKKA